MAPKKKRSRSKTPVKKTTHKPVKKAKHKPSHSPRGVPSVGQWPLNVDVRRGWDYSSDSKTEEAVRAVLETMGFLPRHILQNRFYRELSCEHKDCACGHPLQLDFWIRLPGTQQPSVAIELNGSPHRVLSDFKAFCDPKETEAQVTERFARYQRHDVFKAQRLAAKGIPLVSVDFGTDVGVSREDVRVRVREQLLALECVKRFVDKKIKAENNAKAKKAKQDQKVNGPDWSEFTFAPAGSGAGAGAGAGGPSKKH
jgi:hypothetical protein